MSAITGLACIVAGSQMDESTMTELRWRLNLPELVKENLPTYLHNYLRSIKVAGYEEKIRRKLMILGNTGEQITIILRICCIKNLSKNVLPIDPIYLGSYSSPVFCYSDNRFSYHVVL